jgi:thioredoxin reductase (NADPH)
MASPARSTFETRYDQMFPTLDSAEIERLRRFGERRAFHAGERLVATGEVSPGMFVIESGQVALSQHSVLGRDQPIVTHGPGSFMAELAQLSGQPSLVDARATTPVDTFVVPPGSSTTCSWRRPSWGSASCARSSSGAWGFWNPASADP